MKKVLSLLLVLCMLCGIVAAAVPAEAVTYGYMKGDVDDNSILTIKDVLLVRKYIAGIISDKELNLTAADITGDGRVVLADVLKLRKTLAGIEGIEENNSDGKYKVDTITIDSKNINRYTVILPEDATECMSYSADRLRYYVRRACGIDLNISDTEEGVDTYMIKYLFDTEDNYELGKEGYTVSVEENGDMHFYCGTLRGPLYVTFFFLEEIVGYRFLTAEKLDGSEIEPYIYRAENINVSKGFEETDVPALSYRAAAHAGTTGNNFMMLRTNAVDGHGSSASANIQYGGGVGTLFLHAFSYYYLMGDPEYTSPQPCLTSDDTYETMLQSCIDLVEERKSWGRVLGVDFTQVPVSPNHSTSFCKCQGCVSAAQIDGSMAGPVFRLSNRVAEALDAIYPGIEIFTMAYWDAKFPPKVTRPYDNVCVCYAVGGCNNHPYDSSELCAECGGNPRLQFNAPDGTPTNQNNFDSIGYYDEWCEVTDNIYVWYHCANFVYNLVPSPTLFNIFRDFKYLTEKGAVGIYCEGSTSCYYNFEYLRCYLISKMLWNPYMSEEEYNGYMNEFLMLYYGEGWEYIREYLEMNEAAADENGCFINNYDRPWNMYSESYYLENYLEMRELFDNAIEAASTDVYKERVKMASMHCDFLGLSATYERDYLNGDADTKALYVQRYQALYDMLEANSERPANRKVKLTEYATGKHNADNFPETRDDIYSPMRWISDDFTGYWEWNGASWQ